MHGLVYGSFAILVGLSLVGFIHDQSMTVAQELDVAHACRTSVLQETVIKQRLETVAALEHASSHESTSLLTNKVDKIIQRFRQRVVETW